MIHPSGFAAIAEHRSVTRATNRLGVTASALSQTVRALEERVASRLLNRTTRSVSLTEARMALRAVIDAVVASFRG